MRPKLQVVVAPTVQYSRTPEEAVRILREIARMKDELSAELARHDQVRAEYDDLLAQLEALRTERVKP